MALQSKEMKLVLSSNAKPRLKWTPELHQQFVRAVNQLGGIEKAKPKSLMRAMGIHGLTLYHLKSHLQKYRLGRSLRSQSHRVNKLKGDGENQRSQSTNKIFHGEHEQINENLQVVETLQMQMEVQRKLHEQIEVQRHLQLRIEAQGKYLQSVLRKAQETLSGYISCSIEIDRARDQLSQLASMVDSACPSSSLSVLTENDSLLLEDARDKLLENNGNVPESSLTSSESSARMEEIRSQHEVAENHLNGIGKSNNGKRKTITLSLMEMHPSDNNESDNQVSMKRNKSTVDGAHHTEQAMRKKSLAQNSHEQVKRFRAMEDIDLKCNSQHEPDSGLKMVDLNFDGVEPINGNPTSRNSTEGFLMSGLQY